MKLPKRRRMERKTDYKARLRLLKSGKHRLVVRKTNQSIIAQLVETNIAQDKVLFGITSKILLSKSWPKEKRGSLKSLPAAYLTGYLIGKLAMVNKIKSAIFDIGIYRSIHKSRLYALLKGALDAGLNIPHNPSALPSDKDINKNERLSSLINKIKQNI